MLTFLDMLPSQIYTEQSISRLRCDSQQKELICWLLLAERKLVGQMNNNGYPQ
jgi:hypothetical protein